MYLVLRGQGSPRLLSEVTEHEDFPLQLKDELIDNN